MAVKVVSDKPVTSKRHVCVHCGYELEFNNIDLVPHRTDSDGDALEKRGQYLVCPRNPCGFRNWISGS